MLLLLDSSEWEGVAVGFLLAQVRRLLLFFVPCASLYTLGSICCNISGALYVFRSIRSDRLNSHVEHDSSIELRNTTGECVYCTSNGARGIGNLVEGKRLFCRSIGPLEYENTYMSKPSLEDKRSEIPLKSPGV